MQWLEKMKDWGRRIVQRGAAETGIARSFRTVFELGGVPAFSQFYEFGIFVWKWL